MDEVNEQYPLDSDIVTPEETPAADDSSSSEEEKKEEYQIPASRFNEVYGKMKNLEREISTLKETKHESGLSEEQQRELQAKEYLKGLLKETLIEQKKAEGEAEKQQLENFNQEVSSLLEIHKDVKKDDFLKFVEKEGDDYSSLTAAMKVFKRLNETAKDAAEKAKKEISSKPLLPRNEGKSGGSDYSEIDKGKSLWQIAKEAASELSKK